MATLQTLERGLVALRIIGANPRGITVAALADELGVHRAIAYRIAATLIEHGYVARLDDGRLRLGGALLDLAARYAPQFREANRDLLSELAERCHAAAFISVAEGDQAVVVAAAEPRNSVVRVGYRVGARHPLGRGAAGLAISAVMPPTRGEDPRVTAARIEGCVVTRGELEPGATGLAAGFRTISPDHGTWDYQSVGVVAIGSLNLDVARAVVLDAAARLGEASA